MKTKIIIKNNMYHHVKDTRHIWRVEFNPANEIFFIHNIKTNKAWELTASELTFGNGMTHDIAYKLPDYVHGQVWQVWNFHKN